MSAAVYYQLDNLGVEEYPKHTSSTQTSPSQAHQLPLLARMMPLNHQNLQNVHAHHQNHQNPHQAHYQQHHHQMHPSLAPETNFGAATTSLYSTYGHLLPDLVLQASLYHLSVTNTPASFGASNYIVSTMSPAVSMQPPAEKCICKSNPNRIPRPRNAFILFRQKYHQLVLDEATEAKTNPEVSRELGRRWRALSAVERDHWNSLAEQEKKNHAKKYPNYRYTPRRNGKNKNCPACHKNPRPAINHGQYPQQHDLAAQKLPLAKLMVAPQMQQYYRQQTQHTPQTPQQQQPPQHQQVLQQHQQQQQQPLVQQQMQQQLLAQPANAYLSQQMGQYVYPYQRGQFGYEMPQGVAEMQRQQGYLQMPQQSGVGSQVSASQQQNSPPQQQQGYLGLEAQLQGQYGNFDGGHQHQQRFGSLPVNSQYGYEVFMPSQPQH